MGYVKAGAFRIASLQPSCYGGYYLEYAFYCTPMQAVRCL